MHHPPPITNPFRRSRTMIPLITIFFNNIVTCSCVDGWCGGTGKLTFFLPMYSVQNFKTLKDKQNMGFHLMKFIKDRKYPYRALSGCQWLVTQLGWGVGGLNHWWVNAFWFWSHWFESRVGLNTNIGLIFFCFISFCFCFYPPPPPPLNFLM